MSTASWIQICKGVLFWRIFSLHFITVIYNSRIVLCCFILLSKTKKTHCFMIYVKVQVCSFLVKNFVRLKLCSFVMIWIPHWLKSLTRQLKRKLKDSWKILQNFRKGSGLAWKDPLFGTNVDWKWTSGFTTEYHELTEMFSVDPLNNHCGKIIWNEESDQIMLHDANCHEKLLFICQGELCLWVLTRIYIYI